MVSTTVFLSSHLDANDSYLLLIENDSHLHLSESS